MEIDQKIRDFILTELAFDKDDLTLSDDASLIKQGVVDSLGVLRLMSFIEGEFGIKIPPEEMVTSNFETIAAVRSLIRAKSTPEI